MIISYEISTISRPQDLIYEVKIVSSNTWCLLATNYYFFQCYLISPWTKWTPFRRRHFQMHFFNEKVWISIGISLNFVPKRPIVNNPALFQIMAWHQIGDKPLSEPLLTWCTHSYTVKCHYNACHYNANASLTQSILGSQTAPTCPHDHPRVAQHLG